MTVPSGSSTSPVSSIDQLDASARQLYRRARNAGPEFDEVATAVHSLHKVLKYLRDEAEDPDSLINVGSSPTTAGNGESSQSNVYARQLAPLVEDCDFTLKQLGTTLDKYGSGGNSDDADNGYAGKQHELSLHERDVVALMRTKLVTQKMNIDMFLDTVQLQDPAETGHPRSVVAFENTDAAQLNTIKDKVDAIATRLFRRRSNAGREAGDDLWQQFRTELEAEGFSSSVLRQNKDVLRAYIRELESHELRDDGAPPSVRGLLGQGPTPASSSAITPAAVNYTRNGGVAAGGENASPTSAGHPQAPNPHHYNPDVPHALQPYHHSQPPAMYNQGTGLSFEPHTSSDSSDSEGSSSREMAVISTRDLMAFDRRAADHFAARMSNMHLGLPPPPNYSISPSPGTSPSGRYLPPAGAQPLPIAGAGVPPYPTDLSLSTSPNAYALGTSPRYVPSLLPSYGSPTSSTMSPPPAYASSPGSVAAFPPISTPTSAPNGGPPRFSRLAPDSKGMEIPLEAKWTRIKRTLVSPEVLEKAGVRYEARPEFVAVLGVLTREQIAVFARQSAEVRNARKRASTGAGPSAGGKQFPVRYPDEKRATYNDPPIRGRGSGDSFSYSDSDSSDSDPRRYNHRRYNPKNYDSKDEKDSEKGSRVYPVIVSPPSSYPGESKASPSATAMPKPILKNKNENHVHFDRDGEPMEFDPREVERKRSRHRDRDRSRDRDRERRRRSSRDRDHDRDHDRDRDRDREHRHRRHHRRDRSRERERERERERDREKGRDAADKDKSSTLRNTGMAAGIGGVAATLLSVLTEAASHGL